MEEYKAYHSTLLSSLHEEVQSRLKEIRTRLTALDLERQQPKKKKIKKRKKKTNQNVIEHQTMLANSRVGGKVGKPYFNIQVGKVQKLYKTMKLSYENSHSALTQDLHSYTIDKVLLKINKSHAA